MTTPNLVLVFLVKCPDVSSDESTSVAPHVLPGDKTSAHNGVTVGQKTGNLLITALLRE